MLRLEFRPHFPDEEGFIPQGNGVGPMFRTVFLTLVLLAFVNGGCESISNREVGAERGPASEKIQFLVKADSLSYERTHAIRETIFNQVVASYSLVRTQADFESLFMTHYSKADRIALRESLAKVKAWPTLETIDGALVATLGKAKVVFEWPDITRTEFKVNGIKWAYNPSKPYVPQLRILLKKMELQKQSATAALFLPKAHAIFGFALPAIPAAFKLIAGTVVVTGVTNKLIDNFGATVVDNISNGYCFLLDKGGGVGVLSMCAAWKEKQVEKELADYPALSSLALEEDEGKPGSILGNWESIATSCPKNNDGKDRIYEAWIRKIEFKDGKKSFQGDWAKVRATFGADRKPKSLVIVPRELDPATALEKPETANKIFAKVNFEKTKNKMTGIEVPNPDWSAEKSTLLNGPMLTVSPGLDLTPKQKELLNRAKAMTAYIDKKVTQCIVEAAEESILKGIEPLKPTGDAAKKEPAPSVPMPAPSSVVK